MSSENATRIENALRQFGFAAKVLTPDLFVTPNNVIRMGVPPIGIEILTSISGVEFESSYADKELIPIDDLVIPVTSLRRLRQNKEASGRVRDLADLESLPGESSQSGE